MNEARADKIVAATDETGLKIAVSNAGPTKEVSVVRIDGIVDTMTAGDLEQVISSLTARGRFRLVIDLAGVEYVSSAGWGVFVSYLREIREHAGDIKLARMTPDVCEIYELLEFDGLLPSFDSLEPAVTAFHGDGGRQFGGAPVEDVAPAIKAVENPPGTPGPSPNAAPAALTFEQAVLQVVAEDPFQTIGEIRGQLREHRGERFAASWWKVLVCLHRQHLLSRRARFRYCRRMRKTFI